MTKKEKELEHEKQTLQMMSRVSKHAEVQELLENTPLPRIDIDVTVNKVDRTDQLVYGVLGFMTGCIALTGAVMLMARFI